MPAWSDGSLAELEAAVARYDRPTAEALCGALRERLTSVDEVFPEKEAKKVLTLLRRKRYFDLMQRVADGFIRSGQAAAQIQRQFAQALIDQGELTAALAVLQGMLGDEGIENAEKAEARGLVGRVYKQMYADAPHPTSHQKKAIDEAVSAYYEVYRADPKVQLWHGINAVALKKRAERDHVSVKAAFNASKVAQDILDVVTSRANVYGWDLATAAEACVALSRLDDALEYLKDYVASKDDVDAFEIASLLRQLREIWQIDEKHPMRALTLSLEAALLRRQGGRVGYEAGQLLLAREAMASADVGKGLEKVFGPEGPVTLAWYRQALDLARCVGRVTDQWRGAYGTGFLVRAGDFFPRHRNVPPDELLLVTNAHVMGTSHPHAVRPPQARVQFDELDRSKTYAVKEILFESRVDELDATFARLAGAPPCTAIALAPPEEPAFSDGKPRRFYLIGHPGGEELSVSLHDNLQVGWRKPKLHYRSPTRPGSSGSPVFDSQWRLAALHHAGREDMPRLDGKDGCYQANEGIWIHSIVERTREVV